MELAKEDCGCEKNVGETERFISAAAGTALVFGGLMRRSSGGLLLAGLGAAAIYRAVTGHCMIYDKLRINTARKSANRPEDVKVEYAVTIRRPRQELYQFWRRLENLPRIMSSLRSVEVTGHRTSRWTTKTGLMDLTWNAEIINDIDGELIAWRSQPDSELSTAGSVRFEDAGDGQTHVRVSIAFTPPGGRAGEALAYMLGECPSDMLKDDLTRFKTFMESHSQSGALMGKPVPVM